MNQRIDPRSEIFFMIISAVIFGYFGFATAWPQYTAAQPPQLIPMVVVLKWTLRAGAAAFALSALLAVLGSILGAMLYSIAGLITAGLFLVVAVWDVTSPFNSGIHWILLVIFALWNGFGSWNGLRAVLASRKVSRSGDDSPMSMTG